MPEALAALETSSEVDVETGPWLVFRPAAGEPTTGLILYPGGRVDPRAYAPPARAMAAQGYLVVVVPMPFNLAVFGLDRAADVMAAFSEIQHWALGGHSLGGSMAARFARLNPDRVEGLALWASYPAGGDDLSQSRLRVASIYGTLDGLVTPGDIAASRALLPADTEWVTIEGGNHAQFGWYGPQGRDNPATISREDQQEQIVSATVRLLKDL
jgi:pimeloyl-ACP methyl ester carboxylesterase